MKPNRWQLVVCSASHRTSSLEQREPLQISKHQLPIANGCLGGLLDLRESLILSTCNRVEFYFVVGDDSDPMNSVREFYKRCRNLDIAPFRDVFRVRKDSHAASHLFRVAAGLDSMVLGENQVLGQLKEAYSSSCAVKSTGKVIHRLFHQAFRVGKQVRSDTEMGKGACSVATAAVEMLKDKINGLQDPSILLIGINQMVNIAAMKLTRMKRCHLTIANRSPERAAFLASKFGAESCGLESLTDRISEADIVISCTASQQPIITTEMLSQQSLKRNKDKCILMDLAIPRDISYAQKQDASYEVYDLEDIKSFVESQQNRRMKAIPQAEEIIDTRLREFTNWYEHVQNEPVYNGDGRAIEAIRMEEISPLLSKLTPEMQAELEKASQKLVSRVVKITRRTEAGLESEDNG